MNGEEYVFHIDAFTPATIPMARLAQYLTELSALLGYAESVHFEKLKKGSVRLVARVEREAVPKVRLRLQNTADPGAPEEVRRPYKKIDDMLRSDNAVGKLLRGTSNVVRFPGRDAKRSPRMGPFTERAELDGKIVRVGGTDDTAHALIEPLDGAVISAECSRELAVQLAHHLYGAPVRLIGNARWERTDAGEWKLLSFRAKEFCPLRAEDLATSVARLRKIEGDWRRDDDPSELLRKLREGDSGTH